ncbi:MAG: hypothetical protein RMK57_12360 [Bryobacterales bacterium]|nr:hypothetical protein [Bryobacteraceae bacterium]MDW8355313.1 hypothetical protein [Bryobacterales bacterium]
MSSALVLLALTLQHPAGDSALDKLLARLAEEAAAFRAVAPNVIAEETLTHRARKRPARFRPRIGDSDQPAPPPFETRKVISEYGFGLFGRPPTVLHEVRQVVSVDGRRVAGAARARKRLIEGMSSPDDRRRRHLLEAFERVGIQHAVADFGPVLLLFDKSSQPGYEFRWAGQRWIGADYALGCAFRQRGNSTAHLTVFEAKRMLRLPLEGMIWVRASDLLPMRIELRAQRSQDNVLVRDEAAVDYAMSAHGVLLPVSVVHRQFIGDLLLAENVFHYSNFRRFGAQTDIRFAETGP